MEDQYYRYHYDAYGNLTEKRHKLNSGEVHHYRYDCAHRLVHYTQVQAHYVQHGYYLYDPLGRRVGKQTQYTDAVGQAVSARQTEWYGWDGDNLVLTEHDDGQRIHTVYYPDSFVPLLRLQTQGPSAAPPPTLAETLEQQAGMVLPAEVKTRLQQIEQELRAAQLSERNQQWLQQLSISPDSLTALLSPLPETAKTVHLYHCDHLGTPVALLNQAGGIDWRIELDPWGNEINEDNPQQLYQPIRMQGQHYDKDKFVRNKFEQRVSVGP